MDIKFVDEIVEKCIDAYNKLPKTGKPNGTEWTVLSCIVKIKNNEHLEVISIGTGSKCIGATKMCPNGLVLNDSHAEVMARRGFLIYLYDNIERTFNGQESIFEICQNKCKLVDGVQFVFFSSQLPCGDASIVPKEGDEQQFGEIVKSRKRKFEDITPDVADIDKDIYRTGAKCLPSSKQDPKNVGIGYHLLGQVRTKPGRGDPTLSVSCSDKIARWINLGIQGSLINMFLVEPIYIEHFVFGANVPYSEESLKRALLYRNNVSDSKIPCIPKFYQSTRNFNNIRSKDLTRPTPGSIVWVNLETP